MSKIGAIVCASSPYSGNALQQFLNFKRAFTARFPDFVVEHGFLDSDELTLDTALDKLCEKGVDSIIVVLGVLFVSLHLKLKVNKIVENYGQLTNRRKLRIDILPGLDIDPEFLYAGQKKLEKAGLVKKVRLGNEYVRILSIEKLFAFLKTKLQKNFYYLLKSKPKFKKNSIPLI